MDRTLKLAPVNLIFNAAFAVYNIVSGVVAGSWWLLTLGSYYLGLSLMRFFAIKSKRQTAGKAAGIMLMILSLSLVGTVILSVIRDRGYRLHMIIMIAMAAYAFGKITVAAVDFAKARKKASAKIVTLRNISFADAFVSIFALQRSMLVSFEGMTAEEIQIMNASLGSGVCVVVFLLGLDLVRRRGI